MTPNPAPTVSVLVPRRAICGEGPYWHAASGSVLWVDNERGEILRTDPATLDTAVTVYPPGIGAAAPREAGGLIAATGTGFVGLADDGTVTHRVDCLADGIRMNDAKADPAGIYWSGSCALDFAAGRGGLWRLDENWRAEQVLEGLALPNGLGWSPDGRTFYLVDSMARAIYSYPFDPETSTLTPTPSVPVGPEAFTALPDGLAVDVRGHLWVAEYGGGALHEFAPDGTRVQRIAVPTAQTTSCAFVGPERDQLWVTSAANGLDEDAEPLAGNVFLVTGHGTSGLPVASFRG
ncbi:SMP-30/gluconolactonase/LRE family protein [Microterricola viridarii]|uniref:Sugar lactone lactonase YvrE n=1 Tax=Microterricola viridarii TaxID=412690 RepID=A0A1H1LEK9_9MICO|nr:SMP-30/gluconolactonase/LRE family protein [Microterricola viridarii]SDR73014.1 Sugar lactone lactonase YvrE [Microterricola viridarii]